MAVVVIGGTVLDIQAQPTADELQRGSSVPGLVVQLPGGVGRNIAEAAHHLLARAGQQQQHQQQQSVLLVSVVGQDAAADALLASFAHTGLSTRGLVKSSKVSTPCVVALLDRGGEVAASVADVAAPTVELTPEVVQQHAAAIAAAQVFILDANLPAATLQAAVQVAGAAGVPVMFEPVSVPKAPRCVSFLQDLAAITPNANELLAIADAVQQQHGLPPLQRPPFGAVSDGSSTSSPQQLLARLAPAAAVVLQQGLSCIILTMGSMGAALLTLCSHDTPAHSQRTCPHSQPLVQQPAQQRQDCPHSSSLSPAARALLLSPTPCRRPGSCPHAHATSSGSSLGVAAGRTGPGRCCVRAQHVSAAPAAVVNLSGAGDTLTGGFAAALVRGRDPVHSLALGIAAAQVSVQSKLNVPGPEQGLVYDAVEIVAIQLLGKQQVWEFPVQACL